MFLRISQCSMITNKKKKEKVPSSKKSKLYLSLRKKRAAFRQSLIEAIAIKKEEEEEEEDVCFDTKKLLITKSEEDLLRYYYYVLHAIDDVHIKSIETATLKNILNLVPTKWQMKFSELLNKLLQETKDDYNLTIKKAVIDFVLQEPLRDDHELFEKVLSFSFLFINILYK